MMIGSLADHLRAIKETNITMARLAGTGMPLLWDRRNHRLLLAGVLLLAGCGSEPEAPTAGTPSFQGVSLKVGALDDPAIAAGVTPLRGEWEASRGGSISVVEAPLTLESLATVDVLLFPGQRLGDLVDQRALAVIANAAVFPPKPIESDSDSARSREQDRSKQTESDPFQYMDFAPAFREQASCYGSDRFALPVGGSALVLVYRRDAFESETNRAAALKAGLELKLPETWTQLDQLAAFFRNHDWNGDGKPDFGIVAALGTDTENVGDAVFLARSASLGQHRDQYSFLFDSEGMEPRIDSPPFVEALTKLCAWKALGPPGMEQFDAAAARESFRTGKVAMLIDRAERATTWSHGKPLGVAALPGSERVFEPARKEWRPAAPPNSPSFLPRGGGWLVGVSSKLSGKPLEAALDFVKYLAGPENLNRIRSERNFPMLPVRSSQMATGLPDPTSAADVDSRLWSVAVEKTLLAERVVTGLRIHNADRYLSELAKNRAAAFAGESPESALQAVAKKWAEHTAALGPKRQLWHYRRSLNKLVTLPEPPESGK
jgi:multiple sugar transport system substrate-binding protein